MILSLSLNIADFQRNQMIYDLSSSLISKVHVHASAVHFKCKLYSHLIFFYLCIADTLHVPKWYLFRKQVSKCSPHGKNLYEQNLSKLLTAENTIGDSHQQLKTLLWLHYQGNHYHKFRMHRYIVTPLSNMYIIPAKSAGEIKIILVGIKMCHIYLHLFIF